MLYSDCVCVSSADADSLLPWQEYGHTLNIKISWNDNIMLEEYQHVYLVTTKTCPLYCDNITSRGKDSLTSNTCCRHTK
ncbi:hypothetical protein DPMN_040770 [Dreissena polymorpha]|uniref:Uncharacterized protein n=1 Tax=Dreissena polymorpha TaxID=45954 RepID=A0A9D4CY75_DREPO|nr:hypothetical protein DPMN_040770 [Dreissena polymorpha]